MSRALEAEIGTHLDPLAERLGFARAPELRYGGYDRAWWYSREGDDFATELLCFSLVSRPRRRLLIDLYGSPLALPALAERGAQDALTGHNLFQYQFYLGKAVGDLLPNEIRLDQEADLDEIFARAQAELASVIDDYWQTLYRLTREDDPEWLTRWA